ncbi:hypothetical protein KBZ10_12990 [Streptomyces sp. F63]|uniref:hypothetical protein n=1 Tax=Streptomyces sp. F63 TaxID=2824887 RepID=UPI001B393A72|nr:hypothetical protein [Streptomyces sp. F63]MBQ0985414.1 hypothetical protein [Streptomyces sp. F63]
MAAPRRVTTGTVAAVLALSVAGCSSTGERKSDDARQGSAGQGTASGRVRLIGDGSTAFTGRQPNQPVPRRLAAGSRPPQFVVFSWDGAGEDGQKLFSHFRRIGREYDAQMTYFLSGVYVLPHARREVYKPPRHAPGSSDIGFNDIGGIKATLEQIRGAWQEGNEIGTHFNGHFCGSNGGVGTWTTDEWRSEIEQAEALVKNWKTHTGLDGAPPLPFDYERELVGGRAPCLEGQRSLLPAAKAKGFRYDASSPGGLQVWPSKKSGLWDFPLQQIPIPGRGFETLSMDYNFLANQSGTVRGDPAQHAVWSRQMRDGLLQGFQRAYDGNRAPFFIGNHFESWNGGAYMRAVEEAIKEICPKEDVHCVTFKQLADWLDVQDPEVLAKLRTLGVGQRPRDGWTAFLGGPSAGTGRSAEPRRPAEPAGRARSAGGPGRVRQAAE